MWSDQLAWPTVLAVWSKAGNDVRWRTAHEIVAELDSKKDNWRDQASVSVGFRSEHGFVDGQSARSNLRLRIADESDRYGGFKPFHSEKRRVLLVDLYRPEDQSGFTFALARETDKAQLMLGPFWETGEVDRKELLAVRVLAGAAFLYEEILFPFNSTPAAVHALGPEVFRDLVRDRILVPYRLPSSLGFAIVEHMKKGTVCTFTQADIIRKHIKMICSIFPDLPWMGDLLSQSTRVIRGLEPPLRVETALYAKGPRAIHSWVADAWS